MAALALAGPLLYPHHHHLFPESEQPEKPVMALAQSALVWLAVPEVVS